MKENIRNLIRSHFFLLSNTFWLYLAEATSKGLSLIFFLFVARFLGKEVLGIFSYTLSLASFYFLFADFGIPQIFIRDYQQKENKEEIIKTSLALKIIVSFFFFLLSFSGYFILKGKEYSLLLYLIIIFYLFVSSLRNFFSAFFITTHKNFFNFLSNLVEGLGTLFFVFIISLFSRNSLAIGLSYFLGCILALFISFKFFQKNLEFKFETQKIAALFTSLEKSHFSYYLRNGLPLVLFGILGYIFFSTDQFILGYFRSFEEVGTYAVASKIVLAVNFFGYLLSTAIFPFFSKLISEPLKFKKYFYFFLFVHLILGFFASLAMIPLSPILIYIGFGKEYFDALPLIYSLVWILIFMFPTTFLDYILFVFNKQWLNFWITIVPAILNLVLNFILVPTYGAFGAIFTSLLSQIINFLLTSISSLIIVEKKMKNV